MTISQIKKGLHKASRALELVNELVRTINHNNGDSVMLVAAINTRYQLRATIVRLIELLPNGEILHGGLYHECRGTVMAPTIPDADIDNKTRAAGPDA